MRTYLLLLSAGILLLDRVTKFVVIEKIPLYHEIDVIPGFFQLTHLENTGAAFSLFADMQSPWASRGLLVFSIAAVVVIALLLWKFGNSFNLLTICLALFLGGTLGNLWDRVVSGHVTDFLDFYVNSHHWPPFNVADSAIVVAAILLGGQALFSPSHKREKSKESGGRAAL